MRMRNGQRSIPHSSRSPRCNKSGTPYLTIRALPPLLPARTPRLSQCGVESGHRSKQPPSRTEKRIFTRRNRRCRGCDAVVAVSVHRLSLVAVSALAEPPPPATGRSITPGLGDRSSRNHLPYLLPALRPTLSGACSPLSAFRLSAPARHLPLLAGRPALAAHCCLLVVFRSPLSALCTPPSVLHFLPSARHFQPCVLCLLLSAFCFPPGEVRCEKTSRPSLTAQS